MRTLNWQDVKMDPIEALSVIDGRYSRFTQELIAIFSEFGLIRHRVQVEIQWLIFLLKELKLDFVQEEDVAKMSAIASDFTPNAALTIKEIEKQTNHDVKAVEYYIKQRLSDMGLEGVKEWVHFACTSEDINNTAYALMLKAGREIILAQISEVIARLEALGMDNKSVPMISRTHGQPATPTTLGKEFINFAWRLRHEAGGLRQLPIQAKMNGASGNFNAHYFAFPDIDWIEVSQRFISESLRVDPILFTTQINPYHSISQMLHNLIRIASVIIDLDRDMWGYISLSYLKQKSLPGEVGSSTMPHKVNPIDFENSEGNMGIAISLMDHMAVKLLNSRFQRDLTDSTVLRNTGAVLGHLLIGLKSALKGLNKISANPEVLKKDIDDNPEIIAEAIQTAMRVLKCENPYEKLKQLTRGQKITQKDLRDFVETLDGVPRAYKLKMKDMTVGEYTGLAERLVEYYFKITRS
jgi:adenylosuccinate lyase